MVGQPVTSPLEHIAASFGNGTFFGEACRCDIVEGRFCRLGLRTEDFYLVSVDPIYLVRVSIIINSPGFLAAESELDSLPVYVLVAVDVLVNAGGHNTRTQRKCQIKYCISSHIVDLIYGVSEIPCPAPLRNDFNPHCNGTRPRWPSPSYRL